MPCFRTVPIATMPASGTCLSLTGEEPSVGKFFSLILPTGKKSLANKWPGLHLSTVTRVDCSIPFHGLLAALAGTPALAAGDCLLQGPSFFTGDEPVLL